MIFSLVFFVVVIFLGTLSATEGSIMGRRAAYLKKTYPDMVFLSLSPVLYKWVAESRTDNFELISLTHDDSPAILLAFNSVTLIETLDDEACVMRIPPSIATDLERVAFLVEGKSPGVTLRRAINLEYFDDPDSWPSQLTEVFSFFPYFYENGEQTFSYLAHYLIEILRAAEQIKNIANSPLDRCVSAIQAAVQRDPSLGSIANAFIKRLANKDIVFEDLLPLLQSKNPSESDFGSYLLVNDHKVLSSLTDEQLELLVLGGSLKMSVFETILKESRLRSKPILLLIATQTITRNDTGSLNVFRKCVCMAKSLAMLPGFYRHAIPLVNLLVFKPDSDLEWTEESMCHAAALWKTLIQEDPKLFVEIMSSLKAKDMPQGIFHTIRQSLPLVQLLNGSINSMGIMPFLQRISTFTEREAREALLFAEFCLHLWNYSLQTPNGDTVLTGVATIVSALISRLDSDEHGDFKEKLARITQLGLYRCLAIWFQQQQPMVKPNAIVDALDSVIANGMAPNMITQCLLLKYRRPAGYNIGDSLSLISLITSVAHQFPTRPLPLTPIVKTTYFISFYHNLDTSDGQVPRDLLVGLYRAAAFFIFGIPFSATVTTGDIADDDLLQFWIGQHLDSEGIRDNNLTVCPRWIKSQNGDRSPLSITLSQSS